MLCTGMYMNVCGCAQMCVCIQVYVFHLFYIMPIGDDDILWKSQRKFTSEQNTNQCCITSLSIDLVDPSQRVLEFLKLLNPLGFIFNFYFSFTCFCVFMHQCRCLCVCRVGIGCGIPWRRSSDVCGIPGLLHECWDPNFYPCVCMEVILIAMPPLQPDCFKLQNHICIK